MADISTRMSVSGLSEYKNAMSQAAQSVKTLDAQLKKADAEFKATGDKEKYMADKAKILEERLKAQKNAAKNAQEAMKLLAQNGDTTSTAYQKMAQRLAEAQTGILDTTAAIRAARPGISAVPPARIVSMARYPISRPVIRRMTDRMTPQMHSSRSWP